MCRVRCLFMGTHTPAALGRDWSLSLPCECSASTPLHTTLTQALSLIFSLRELHMWVWAPVSSYT